jgi:carbonic anhydrase
VVLKMEKEFVTCLNCIDGRVQLPVINWINENFGTDYVDMITYPGINGILAGKNSATDDIQEKIELSIAGHSSSQIFVVGHHDCLANPVSDKIHKEQIIESVGNIKQLNLSCSVTGLWVDVKQVVHEVCTLN